MNGKQLKTLRESCNISREDLAAHLGIARQTIRKYEIYDDQPDKGLPIPENKITPIKRAIKELAGENIEIQLDQLITIMENSIAELKKVKGLFDVLEM